MRSTYTFALHLSTMKKPLLFLLVAFFSLSLSAQKVYYIYLQTEDQTPFYVRFSGKLYNSTQSGYLIISNLSDSSYKLSVGFPTGVKPEFRYVVSTNGSDRGFIIKSTDETTTLIDQNTEAIVKAENDEDKKIIGYETKTDKFSTTLSKAADDPTLLKVPIRAKEEPRKEEPKTEVVLTKTEEPKQEEVVVPTPAKESVAANKRKTKGKQKAAEIKTDEANRDIVVTDEPKKEVTEEPKSEEVIKVVKEPQQQKEVSIETPKAEEVKVTAEPKKEEVKPVEQPKQEVIDQIPGEVFKRSVVSRVAETSTTEGFGLVYYDISSGSADTVRLLIPNPKVPLVADNASKPEDQSAMLDPNKVAEVLAKKEETIIENKEPVKEKKQSIIKKKKVKTEEPVLERQQSSENKINESSESGIKVPSDNNIVVVPPSDKKAASNSSCGAEASEKDFFKLRKTMAAKSTDESMIDEAKKYFRSKCFTTEQIRYLSTLFLTSAGKYQFFDSAYDHASDKGNFTTLQNEIKDPYYLKRFKALIGE